MQFELLIQNPGGLLQRQVLQATDADAAQAMAAQRGWQVVTWLAGNTSANGNKLPHPAAWQLTRQKRFAPVLFTQELLALLNAGLTLVETLEALAEKEDSPQARALFEALLLDLRQGHRFSEAVARHPQQFSPLFVGLLQSAEKTSDLGTALSGYIAYQQRMDSFRAKLVSALIYPVVLLVVGSLVALFLMGFVVPRFAAVYEGGNNIPAASRLLLLWGNWLNHHAGLAAAIGLALLLGLATGLRWMGRQQRWASLAARTPGLAAQVRLIALARLYLTLGMLMEGGMTAVQAIDLSSPTTGADLPQRLKAARLQIVQGQSMSEAFAAQGLLTPVSQRMMRVGERSGQMGLMLSRAAVFYDTENARWLERFTKIIEPLLMAVIGLAVGAIVVMLYLPIFDLASAI